MSVLGLFWASLSQMTYTLPRFYQKYDFCKKIFSLLVSLPSVTKVGIEHLGIATITMHLVTRQI